MARRFKTALSRATKSGINTFTASLVSTSEQPDSRRCSGLLELLRNAMCIPFDQWLREPYSPFRNGRSRASAPVESGRSQFQHDLTHRWSQPICSGLRAAALSSASPDRPTGLLWSGGRGRSSETAPVGPSRLAGRAFASRPSQTASKLA
jgi:hypothetical protein